MGTKKSMPKRIVGFSLGAIAALVVGAADITASSFNHVITRWWSGTFTTVKNDSGDTKFKAQNAAADLTEDLEAEGAVLLKNGKASGNQALPLKTSEAGTIALLGYASYSPVKGGAGSVSQGSTIAPVDFYEAFDVAGFKVDKTMKEYYEKYGKDNGASGGMLSTWKQASGVNDQPLYVGSGSSRTVASEVYKTALDTASSKAKTAVVVISRVGAEGGDVYHSYSSDYPEDEGKTYLSLVKDELDLIEYSVANFEKTIVLINSSHVMELGELDGTGANAKYDVDGLLWIGGAGNTGLQAIPDIISGDVNPSGHLTDTYPYKLSTMPAYYCPTSEDPNSQYGRNGKYQNAMFNSKNDAYSYMKIDGIDYTFDNYVDSGVVYDVEGIYVGYRWYETADAEGFWTSQFAKDTWGVNGYDTVVQYPFGYGLSYTSFDWKVKNSHFGDVNGKITIDVEVTNTGAKAGKDVVELYFTAPYSKTSHIEKSSKVLGAFAKTGVIAPGKSETVTLEMDVDDIASYDYRGHRCYVAEKGTYEFNLQSDSHNIKKNKNGNALDTIKYEVKNDRIYNDNGVGKRSSDEVVAENHFDFSSNGDGMIGTWGTGTYKLYYTSREDFVETHPRKYLNGKTINELTDLFMSDAMIKYITEETPGGSDIPFEKLSDGTYHFKDEVYVSQSKVKVETGAKNGLTINDLAGYDNFDDEIWDLLINQMTTDELTLILEQCGYGSPAIESIGIGQASDADGPAGISSSVLNYSGNSYTTEPVMASTWNTELLYKVGASVARESALAGVNGWYAPGCNTHKNPFNGRNAEYFSEDPLLGGKMAASEVAGAQDGGLYAFIKHFTCNESDQNRGGLYTWVNEQELREIQLKAFEYPVKEGGALGVMSAYNRIGCAETSTCYGLQTNVLRNEWGFKGISITDGYSPNIGCEKYEHPDIQLRAGAGQLLYTGSFQGNFTPGLSFSANTYGTEKGVEMLHDAAKRIVYRYCNSNAMTVSRDYTPYWIIPLVAFNVVVLGGGACAVVFLGIQPKKKEEK